MSLRSFLCATEVLRLQQTDGFHVETQTAEPTPADVKQRNAQSMQALQAMMGGVKR